LLLLTSERAFLLIAVPDFISFPLPNNALDVVVWSRFFCTRFAIFSGGTSPKNVNPQMQLAFHSTITNQLICDEQKAKLLSLFG